MRLRKVAQGDPTATVDFHGELKPVDFSVSQQVALGRGSAVDDYLHQPQAAFHWFAGARGVQFDGVADHAAARRGCQLAVGDGFRDFRSEGDLRRDADLARLIDTDIVLANLAVEPRIRIIQRATAMP